MRKYIRLILLSVGIVGLLLCLLYTNTQAQDNKPIVKHIQQGGNWTTLEITVYNNIQQLEDWQSIEELEKFLLQDTTDKHLFVQASNSGIIQLSGNCEDYAFQLRDNAYSIGKRLETEIMTAREYYLHFNETGGLGQYDGHYINKAVIENEVWFVEPRTDEIWLAYYLD